MPDAPVRFWVALALLLVMAAWLRFSGLSKHEVWFDEACTFYVVDHLFDFPPDGPDPRTELAHVPYFFLLRCWTDLVGRTAWGLRSFSALCGVLAVGVVGLMASRLTGRGVGLIAAALAAVHPLHVYYSQEARVYAFWTVETMVVLWLLLSAARTERARAWFAFGMTAAVTVLTHYYTLFWLVGVAGAFLVVRHRRGVVRQWLVTHLALTAFLVPTAWWLIVPLSRGGPTPWLTETWLGYPPLLAIPRSLWGLLPSGGNPDYLGTAAVAAEVAGRLYGGSARLAATWGAAFITCGLAALGLVAGRRQSNTKLGGPGGQDDWGADQALSLGPVAVFMVASVMLFLVSAWVYSAVVRPAYVVGRYDMAAWPAAVIAVALLIEGAARRLGTDSRTHALGRVLFTAALAGCSSITLLAARAVPASHDTAERARRVAKTVANDDLVVSLGMYRWFMTYEWHRLGFAPQVVSFPTRHDRQLCWANAEAELADEAGIERDLDTVTGTIEEALARGRRVWLLAHGEPEGARWQVDRQLFARLGERGIHLEGVDEWTGLAALRLQSAGGRPAEE